MTTDRELNVEGLIDFLEAHSFMVEKYDEAASALRSLSAENARLEEDNAELERLNQWHKAETLKANEAAALPQHGEPVAYQQRERRFDSDEWSDWYPSNKGAFDEYKSGESGSLREYEVRALYASPPSPAPFDMDIDDAVIELFGEMAGNFLRGHGWTGFGPKPEQIEEFLTAALPYLRGGAEWQPVRGWENLYEVSNTGRLRKFDGTPVGQWTNEQGYMLARLSQPRAIIRVHRAVAEAFVQNPCGLPFVNHKDNNRAHNCAFNLEWCTQKENLDHARRQGRMQEDYWIGKRSPNASLPNETVLEIRRLYSGGAHSWQSLADQFGISKRAIGRIIKRETYTDV